MLAHAQNKPSHATNNLKGPYIEEFRYFQLLTNEETHNQMSKQIYYLTLLTDEWPRRKRWWYSKLSLRKSIPLHCTLAGRTHYLSQDSRLKKTQPKTAKSARTGNLQRTQSKNRNQRISKNSNKSFFKVTNLLHGLPWWIISLLTKPKRSKKEKKDRAKEKNISWDMDAILQEQVLKKPTELE